MAENMFSSRKEAVNHLKTVVLEASGQGVQIDAKASGKSRVVFRCPAVFRLQEEVEVGAPTHEAACQPCGSKSGDGARVRKRSKDMRPGGRSSAESGRSVLENFALAGFE